MSANDNWAPLALGPFGAKASVAGIDPMWVWADATNYREHNAQARRSGFGAWFAAELAAPDAPPDERFVSLWLTPDDWVSGGAKFARLELAEPVIPERPAPNRRASAGRAAQRDIKPSRAETLVGVIDSGCPFASRMLRAANGDGTRVAAIWDQDDAPAFLGHGGYVPAGLNYGCAIDRVEMNALISQATQPDGCVDEERSYAAAGYSALRERYSHGGAVLSQLFARPVQGSALCAQPGQPPQWDRDTRNIDSADLVFVQLPKAGVQDSTSAALTRHVIDGIRFIMAHATPGQTKRVVINISSGTSRGLHDGGSLLHRAVDGWIDHARDKLGVELWVVVAMGNTNEEQRHAVLRGQDERTVLFVPPSSEMPQYVTVAWPAGLPAAAALKVTAPGGQTQSVRLGEAFGLMGQHGTPRCGVVLPRAPRGKAALGLLAFAPTAVSASDRIAAPAGRWTLALQGVSGTLPASQAVKFWVSRNQRNPGACRRGWQAAFIDWDESHNLQRFLRRDEVDHGKPNIRRAGALSALACLQRADGRFVAVGGCVVFARGLPPSFYSAAGFDAGSRAYADVLAPADSSRALPGLTVRGNLSGQTARVSGTSFAAPLLARALVNTGRLPSPPASGVADHRQGATLRP